MNRHGWFETLQASSRMATTRRTIGKARKCLAGEVDLCVETWRLSHSHWVIPTTFEAPSPQEPLFCTRYRLLWRNEDYGSCSYSLVSSTYVLIRVFRSRWREVT